MMLPREQMWDEIEDPDEWINAEQSPQSVILG